MLSHILSKINHQQDWKPKKKRHKIKESQMHSSYHHEVIMQIAPTIEIMKSTVTEKNLLTFFKKYNLDLTSLKQEFVFLL